MNRKLGIKDIHGTDIKEGDTVQLSCGCCFYQITWDDAKNCLWPIDDGFSQVHNKDIDVFKSEMEIVERELEETK